MFFKSLGWDVLLKTIFCLMYVLTRFDVPILCKVIKNESPIVIYGLWVSHPRHQRITFMVRVYPPFFLPSSFGDKLCLGGGIDRLSVLGYMEGIRNRLSLRQEQTFQQTFTPSFPLHQSKAVRDEYMFLFTGLGLT